MRNNLIPTAVTDKNGKQTTVHKKQQSASSGASSIPAPALKKTASSAVDEQSWEGRQKELLNRFHAALVDNNGGRELGRDKTIFIVQSPSRMQILFTALMERNDGFGGIISAATSSSLPDNKKPGSKFLESIALVYDKDLFTEFPELKGQKSKARENFLKLNRYMSALLAAVREPAINLTRAQLTAMGETGVAPEAVSRVKDYVKLYAAYREVDSGTERKPYEAERIPGELAAYALDCGHSIDEVVAVMREHETLDVNTIAGILDGVVPSIAQGWL